uniref:Uncharacterized protein n=1 Tax=Steinernema glaseri TaxID=37863 RepID=A0A1I8AI77_9BILA
MPSYDNSCVLYEEISLRRDDLSDATSVLNQEALREYLDEIQSELSEFEWSDHGGESDEVRSEYCWDGMDVVEPPKAPQAVRSEYAMDFDKRI